MSKNQTSNTQNTTLSAQMRCGIFSNAKGEILIAHDQPISSNIEWIEYDRLDHSFFLVYQDGSTQPLGIDLDKKMQNNIQQASEINLMHLDDGKLISLQKIVFIVK